MSAQVLDVVLFVVALAVILLIAVVSLRGHERRLREHNERVKEMYRRSGRDDS